MFRNKLSAAFATAFAAALSLLFLVSCREKPFQLQDGDLLFVVDGGGRFEQAITEATGRRDTWHKDSLSFSHVAIGFVENGCEKVIDASPENGVSIQSLQDFLSTAPVINSQPAVVVKRLNRCPHHLRQKAVENARQYLNESYDWSFLADNGKMYCSELVHESFRYTNGEPVFQNEPMNFLAPDSTLPEFWVKLFNELGESVPQGLPGSNPNRLSQDARLREIYRFF